MQFSFCTLLKNEHDSTAGEEGKLLQSSVNQFQFANASVFLHQKKSSEISNLLSKMMQLMRDNSSFVIHRKIKHTLNDLSSKILKLTEFLL